MHGRLSKSHFLSILGKMVVTPTADPNNPSEEFEGLETRAVEVLGQFSLESDDPANYTDRFTFMQAEERMARQEVSSRG